MGKKEAVKGIFNDIAPHYDRLNHFLSFNIDKSWRKKAIACIGKRNEESLILDVACGTGDFAIAAAGAGAGKIIGVDIAENMVEIGRRKVKEKGLEDRVTLACGDSEQLAFDAYTFDAVTVAFGVRNFEHLEKGLTEMYRVLKEGGQVIILEFSMPERCPMKQLYTFYFRYILPVLGGAVSGNKGAYTYLPESVLIFPQGKEFLNVLTTCGFTDVSQKRLTFGIATLYIGYK